MKLVLYLAADQHSYLIFGHVIQLKNQEKNHVTVETLQISI